MRRRGWWWRRRLARRTWCPFLWMTRRRRRGWPGRAVAGQTGWPVIAAAGQTGSSGLAVAAGRRDLMLPVGRRGWRLVARQLPGRRDWRSVEAGTAGQKDFSPRAAAPLCWRMGSRLTLRLELPRDWASDPVPRSDRKHYLAAKVGRTRGRQPAERADRKPGRSLAAKVLQMRVQRMRWRVGRKAMS